MTDSKIRITVTIEADAALIDQLGEVLGNVFGRAELPKPAPTPFSRPENMSPHLVRPRRQP